MLWLFYIPFESHRLSINDLDNNVFAGMDNKRNTEINQQCIFVHLFSGGVLFATAFLHVIPEVRLGFDRYHIELPITELVVCLGFLAVYLVEEVNNLRNIQFSISCTNKT